jgi:hypothetical protein
MRKRLSAWYRELRRTIHAGAWHLDVMATSATRIEYQTLLNDPRYADPRCLANYGFGAYSQSDEDGIIEEIFRRIGTDTKKFVEFGSSDGLESNGHYLLLKGWSGLWIDGDPTQVERGLSKFREWVESGALTWKNAFLEPENINEVLGPFVRGGVDLLSVDIDGNDFHVAQGIQMDVLKPRVIAVEYNARKGPSLDWVMPYQSGYEWDGRSDVFGASLKAWAVLLADRGYSLVGCNLSGVNAFFVRNDLITPDQWAGDFTTEGLFEPMRRNLRLGMQCSPYGRDAVPFRTAASLIEDPSRGEASSSRRKP